MILKKNHCRFVVLTFILKTSIIDDWLVAWLGHFQLERALICSALSFFAHKLNKIDDLIHIRESEVYLNMRELLYTVIAIYIITVLIKISAKFESHNNLSAVSRYLSTIFPSKFQNSGTRV